MLVATCVLCFHVQTSEHAAGFASYMCVVWCKAQRGGGEGGGGGGASHACVALAMVASWYAEYVCACVCARACACQLPSTSLAYFAFYLCQARLA